MKVYRQTIEKCAQSLAQHMEGNEADNRAIINYALQLVVFNSLVALSTLGVALLLGTFKTTLLALMAGGSLRIFTGGYHLSNPLPCLILTVTSFNIFGKLAVLLSPYATTANLTVFTALVLGLALFFILKNAPVETPNRPIRPERRPGLKRKGLMVWLFWSIVAVVLILLPYRGLTQFVLAIGMGIANQTLSISKLFK